MLLFGMKDDRLHSSLVYINCQIRGHLFRSHLTALQNHRKYCEYRTHSTPINITMCLQNRSLSFSAKLLSVWQISECVSFLCKIIIQNCEKISTLHALHLISKHAKEVQKKKKKTTKKDRKENR